MKGIFSLTVFFLICLLSANAQQKLDPKGMNYVISPKPNTIIYHDSVFTGVKQFKQLFYRTRNNDLINLVEKHQSNKISGQILGFIGTIVTISGIRRLSSSDANKGAGWALVGGGFAATLTGGYLMLKGQEKLLMAVTLFNKQNRTASLGIGVSDNRAGLVYKF